VSPDARSPEVRIFIVQPPHGLERVQVALSQRLALPHGHCIRERAKTRIVAGRRSPPSTQDESQIGARHPTALTLRGLNEHEFFMLARDPQRDGFG